MFRRFPGQPQNVLVENRRANQTSYTGVIFNNTPGMRRQQCRNCSGTGVVPFNIGQYGWRGLFTNEVGGDGRSIYDGATMIPETERSNVMVSMSYDFTDNLRGFFDASFANVLGVNIQEAAAGFGSDQVDNCITPDNAYLVGDTALGAAGARKIRQRRLLLVQQSVHIRARCNGRAQGLHARGRPDRQHRQRHHTLVLG